MPPVPWHHRMRIGPQPDAFCACSLFRLCIGLPVRTGLFRFVLLVVPGESRPDLLEIDVQGLGAGGLATGENFCRGWAIL